MSKSKEKPSFNSEDTKPNEEDQAKSKSSDLLADFDFSLDAILNEGFDSLDPFGSKSSQNQDLFKTPPPPSLAPASPPKKERENQHQDPPAETDLKPKEEPVEQAKPGALAEGETDLKSTEESLDQAESNTTSASAQTMAPPATATSSEEESLKATTPTEPEPTSSTQGASASAGDTKGKGAWKRGMAVFTLAKGGLMYEASIGGQKYKFKPL